MFKLNKAWMLSLVFGFVWTISVSLSDAYAPGLNAVASAKTVAPCKPNPGQPDRNALSDSPFLEPEDGSFAHVEFAKPLKFYLLAEKPAANSPGIEIHSPELTTPVANRFVYLLSTPVLVL